MAEQMNQVRSIDLSLTCPNKLTNLLSSGTSAQTEAAKQHGMKRQATLHPSCQNNNI